MKSARPVDGSSSINWSAAMSAPPPQTFIPEEWAIWCKYAPRLVEILAPLLRRAPKILKNKVHLNAIFAIYMARRERFGADAPVFPGVENDNDIPLYLENLEENFRKRTSRNLQFDNYLGVTRDVWPLAWKSLRVMASIPRKMRPHQVDWVKLNRHPIQGLYARVVADLIATAMHK